MINEIVSIVAHQLKNPISILRGYLEALLSKELGEINPKQTEYLEDSLENLKTMRKLIDDLLDISRIEEKKYFLNLKKISLEDLIKEIIDNMLLWAKALNSKIVFAAENNLPPALADSLKIRQVVENIISNALKYRGAGPGEIDINLKKRGKFVLFSCRDKGIGIAKKDSPKIFSKFYRSKEALGLDPSGTGLGLYINKAIVGLSGGKIWFEKNKGPGATFYFTLPVAK